jgi:DnaJ-class molecular chaperone
MTARTRTNHYRTLGVDRGASPDEIKQAYHDLVHRYHPDVNPGDPEAEDRFRAINEAYATLSDPDERSRYDASRSAATVRRPAGQAPAPTGMGVRRYSVGLNIRVGGVSLPLGGASLSVGDSAEVRSALRKALRELIEAIE